MKNLLFTLAFLLTASVASAQVTVPYTFQPNDDILSAEVNANFAKLSDALNRTGGTATGTLTSSGGGLSGSWAGNPTFSGNPVFSGNPSFTGTPTFSNSATFPSLVLTGGLTAGSGIVGIIDSTGKIPSLTSTYIASLDGSALTSLSAANITAGGTLPALDGSALTALNASNLGSGTVPDARFPATLPAVSGANLTSLPAANLTGTISAGTQQAISQAGALVTLGGGTGVMSTGLQAVTNTSSLSVGAYGGVLFVTRSGLGSAVYLCDRQTQACLSLGTVGTVGSITVAYSGGDLEITNNTGSTISLAFALAGSGL